jgi:hypothetical protein
MKRKGMRETTAETGQTVETEPQTGASITGETEQIVSIGATEETTAENGGGTAGVTIGMKEGITMETELNQETEGEIGPTTEKEITTTEIIPETDRDTQETTEDAAEREGKTEA